MSDAEGAFSTPAVITRQFSTPHTFPGLTLTFDTRYQEWALADHRKVLSEQCPG